MTYLKKIAISFFAVLLIVAGTNWFIDPFGMYWSPQVKGVNTTKPNASTRTRITKGYQVKNIQPTILIVGNSRVEIGIDPQNPLFEGQKVYNQGMPGTKISMQVDYAIHALSQNSKIQQIYMSIDFLDFLVKDDEIFTLKPSVEVNPKYTFRFNSFVEQSPNQKLDRIRELGAFIFSIDALSASIKTFAQQGSLVNSIDQFGFNSAGSYQAIMKSEGIKPLFRQKLQEIDKRLRSKLVIQQRKSFPYSSSFAQIDRLIKYTTDNKIKITFFINPYHYSYLKVLADNQQLSNFFLWKELLASYFTNHIESNIPLWDFSHINEVINEKVTIDSPKTMMKWFWEPAHYKESLGSIMLENMIKKVPETFSFGHLLTLHNVTKLNNDDRKNLNELTVKWQILQAELDL